MVRRMRFLLSVCITAVVLAAVGPSAMASEVSVSVPAGGKYPAATYLAYPGEQNNLNLQHLKLPVPPDGLLFHIEHNELVWLDLGAPVIRSRSLECVNSVFSAFCEIDGLDSIEILLGDQDDRADVSGSSAVRRVSCGSGYDKVVVKAGNEGIADADCEQLIVV